MPRYKGYINRLHPGEEPTNMEWLLDKDKCSDDLFTVEYKRHIEYVFDVPDDDTLREWYKDNRGCITNVIFATMLDLKKQNFYNWLTGERSLSYCKAEQLVRQVRAFNPDASYIHFPSQVELSETLRKLVKDGYIFARPNYISWYFRADYDMVEQFFLQFPITESNTKLQNLQFPITVKKVKKWISWVFSEYNGFYWRYNSGLKHLVFREK